MTRRTPAEVALTGGLNQLVRRGLRGVWLRGALPHTGTVWAANHHSWWDGFIASTVLSGQGRRAGLIMDGDNLASFGFLAPLGVISAQRPRQALALLREDRVLVVFPEGELRPPGPLGPIAPGAGWLADHAPAHLVPVAVRIANRGHQYPEALVDIGEPVPATGLAERLAELVANLDRELEHGDPRGPVPGFYQVARGKSSWDERISRVSALVGK